MNSYRKTYLNYLLLSLLLLETKRIFCLQLTYLYNIFFSTYLLCCVFSSFPVIIMYLWNILFFTHVYVRILSDPENLWQSFPFFSSFRKVWQKREFLKGSSSPNYYPILKSWKLRRQNDVACKKNEGKGTIFEQKARAKYGWRIDP